MIRAIVPTDSKRLDWKEHIKSLEDYVKLEKTGMMWVWFPDIPLTWVGCLEELNKERELDGKC